MERYPTWPNLAAMMFDRARSWTNKPMLRAWRDGRWHSTTWGEFAVLAAACARSLRAAGVSAGDRVLICSENRPEYPIVEIALMAIRAVPVPAYVTNTPEDHAHLLRDSGARAAIVSTPALADRVRAGAASCGGLDLLVVMDAPRDAQPPVVAWSALVANLRAPDDIIAEAATIPRTAMACLIYTSGTGGAPRGVMLPHRSILANCEGASDLVRPLRLKDEIYLSYLPLAHAFEHTVGQFFLLSIGTEIVYARGVEHLAADMLSVRPTVLSAVPRVLDVIRGRILGHIGREKSWRQRLFHAAVRIGERKLDGESLSWIERLVDPLLDRLVRAKIRARFGGRLVAAISGGARLEPELGRFFLAMGLTIMQGYGQTEAGPVISATRPDAIRVDTVGPPLQGVELKLADDGEILVRGDLVMDGYWGRPADTTATIVDGWLHTGDIGELDGGSLRITDRKRDMIVLSGGENVSPAKVEGRLVAEPEIAQAVVAGDGWSGLTALVVPTEGAAEESVAHAIARANKHLSVTERIRKHAIVSPFTVENGLLTPSHKVRRLLVIRANHQTLAALH